MNSISPQSRTKRGASAVLVAVVSLAGVIALAGCAGMPTGPTVMALPGTGKSFDQFRADDALCQHFASQQTGGVSTQQAAATGALGGTAIGTALGAAAGAAFNGRRGAAVGAGVGLLGGSMIGSSMAQSSATSLQHRYDQAYVQCMYANGERVPVPRSAADVYRTQNEATRFQPAYNTQPPPGY
ncbi:YMGG-like glycine zipper-containing protein [Paraburkholderia sp. CNPSo 3274]|uniref:YMGG-like glycine zipper-containing protein n=1 Tax=Paraburkholderia sp. CNPSo 3274 TaxID=2940932 RepID=UPI0020B7A040|nr:YMGG-like glycine zipper-containing protein [Paraburkholderia sp. CNPSo 3274]MCP3713470.1 YMGG-like glycine zipper-containing protein [Paraburkholderia sp. CNPSo 3274]